MTDLDSEKKIETVIGQSPASPVVQDRFKNISLTSLAASFLAGIIGGIIGINLVADSNGTVINQRTKVVEEESAVIEVAEKTKPAIVSVLGTKKVSVSGIPDDFLDFFPFAPVPRGNDRQEQQVSAGTGFFVTADGLIATNKHVIDDQAATYKVFTNDGRQFTAQVVARDPVNDIALLKISGDSFPVLDLGDSDKIRVGQRVIAIGNALGQFTNTVTSGVVSGINRSIVATGQTQISQIEGAIQTDAAINPGNSGGPLLDLEGNVLGINTAMSASGQSLGFAIPVNDLRKDIEVYGKQARIVKPYIGVRYIMLTKSLQEQEQLPVDKGAWVTRGDSTEPAILPDSPAQRAGIQEGDIILKVNGKEINLEYSLAGSVKNMEPGDIIELIILRDNREIKINLTLAERTN